MLILLISLLLANSCIKPEPQFVAIGDAHTIGRLKNGNWEVTPAYVVEFALMKWKIETIELEIEKLKALLKELEKK